MRRILTAKQMKQADQMAIDGGLPSLVLMERAAMSVVSVILHRKLDLTKIAVFCGPGNNGGDGVAIARILKEYGCHPEVYVVGDPAKYSQEMKEQLQALKDVTVESIDAFQETGYSLIVDAIFGIGLTRNVEGSFARAIELINTSAAKVVSVDIPSGIHTDTGAVLGLAVKADYTVTFAAAKPAHYLYPGAAYIGKLSIRKVGISPEINLDKTQEILDLEEKDLQGLRLREEDGNKGSFGKLLVIAGSAEITGAAYFAAKSALRTGVGMVKVYTAEHNRNALTSLLPEALYSFYSGEKFLQDTLQKDLNWADAVVIGPGLGNDWHAAEILLHVLEDHKNRKQSLILDADALNLLSDHPDWWDKIDEFCVLTPHMMEMSRISGRKMQELKADPLGEARHFAMEKQVTLVMKDAVTTVASPDGRVLLGHFGTSGMATAGSGDVLAGIIGGLVTRSRGVDLTMCAAQGVMIHGLAGCAAARRFSANSMIAGDMLDCLCELL